MRESSVTCAGMPGRQIISLHITCIFNMHPRTSVERDSPNSKKQGPFPPPTFSSGSFWPWFDGCQAFFVLARRRNSPPFQQQRQACSQFLLSQSSFQRQLQHLVIYRLAFLISRLQAIYLPAIIHSSCKACMPCKPVTTDPATTSGNSSAISIR